MGDSEDGTITPFETRSKEWNREWSYQDPDVIKGIVKDHITTTDYGICESDYFHIVNSFVMQMSASKRPYLYCG